MFVVIDGKLETMHTEAMYTTTQSSKINRLVALQRQTKQKRTRREQQQLNVLLSRL